MMDYLNSKEARETARKYADILHAARPASEESLRKHPRMPLENRAKIFSPFAALRGYEQEIAREGWKMRRVERPTPSEGEIEKLSAKLAQVMKGMEVQIFYFQEDTADRSDRHMGCYCEIVGKVEAVDPVAQTIRINGQVIPFADIQDVAGSMILGEENIRDFLLSEEWKRTSSKRESEK